MKSLTLLLTATLAAQDDSVATVRGIYRDELVAALAVQISVRLPDEGNRLVPVTSPFRSGQRIQFEIQSNRDAYVGLFLRSTPGEPGDMLSGEEQELSGIRAKGVVRVRRDLAASPARPRPPAVVPPKPALPKPQSAVDQASVIPAPPAGVWYKQLLPAPGQSLLRVAKGTTIAPDVFRLDDVVGLEHILVVVSSRDIPAAELAKLTQETQPDPASGPLNDAVARWLSNASVALMRAPLGITSRGIDREPHSYATARDSSRPLMFEVKLVHMASDHDSRRDALSRARDIFEERQGEDQAARLRVRLVDEDNRAVPVTFPFRSGQRLRFEFELSGDAYVWIFHKNEPGSPDRLLSPDQAPWYGVDRYSGEPRARGIAREAASGTSVTRLVRKGSVTQRYRQLLPTTPGEALLVRRGSSVTMPVFRLDEATGIERLLVVVAPREVRGGDLERIVADASGDDSAESAVSVLRGQARPTSRAADVVFAPPAVAGKGLVHEPESYAVAPSTTEPYWFRVDMLHYPLN